MNWTSLRKYSSSSNLRRELVSRIHKELKQAIKIYLLDWLRGYDLVPTIYL